MEEEDETEREVCHPSFGIAAKDSNNVTITYDNYSTDKNLSITVIGNNVDGKSYDKNEFGNDIEKYGNATQLSFRLPVDATKSYTITQQNPALAVFYPEGGDGIAGSTKHKEYDGSTLATEDYNILLTDKRGPVRIEVKDNADNSIVQNITINYRLSFAKNTVGG